MKPEIYTPFLLGRTKVIIEDYAANGKRKGVTNDEKIFLESETDVLNSSIPLEKKVSVSGV